MKDLYRFIRQYYSAGADKFVGDLLYDVTNMSDPRSSNMRHMVGLICVTQRSFWRQLKRLNGDS